MITNYKLFEQSNHNLINESMQSIEFLNFLKEETQRIIETVKSEFQNLNPELFNTKPSDEKWSIAECLQHLNLTLDIYIPQMMEIIKQKEKFGNQKEYFKHSFIGKMAVKSMEPKPDKSITFKMKTFNKLSPKLSKSDKNEILDIFLNFQESILNVIDGLHKMSLIKPKIVTAAGPILKMNIGDALHFMVAHNQRHILQAQNVLQIIN